MRFDVRWIDVAPFVATRTQPVFVLPRPAGAEFWVADGDVLNSGGTVFPVSAGEGVRVPVWAYATGRSMSHIFALGVQVGLAAAAELRKHTADAPAECVLLIGHECTDLGDGFRCCVGVAFRTG